MEEVKDMPRRDGTGPIGLGSMTGRRAGFCNSDIDKRNFSTRFSGNGCQRGFRRQFTQTGIPGCVRTGYAQSIPEADEKTALEMQETRLENQLKLVRERLSNLNTIGE
jgi:hypothetical protein